MVKISVKVKPNSKQESVEQTGDGEYSVRVKEKALEGRANAAVVDALSTYFNVPKRRIAVLKGLKSRNKIVAIS